MRLPRENLLLFTCHPIVVSDLLSAVVMVQRNFWPPLSGVVSLSSYCSFLPCYIKGVPHTVSGFGFFLTRLSYLGTTTTSQMTYKSFRACRPLVKVPCYSFALLRVVVLLTKLSKLLYKVFLTRSKTPECICQRNSSFAELGCASTQSFFRY